MSVKQLLILDSTDDRKEIFSLLTRLPPRQRLAWLRHCCSLCTLPHSKVHPVVPPTHNGNAMEVFLDGWVLVRDYSLDMSVALTALVALARKG